MGREHSRVLGQQAPWGNWAYGGRASLPARGSKGSDPQKGHPISYRSGHQLRKNVQMGGSGSRLDSVTWDGALPSSFPLCRWRHHALDPTAGHHWG